MKAREKRREDQYKLILPTLFVLRLSLQIDFIQNTRELGDGHAVIGNRHALALSPVNPGHDMAAVKHAGAAVDNQVIAG